MNTNLTGRLRSHLLTGVLALAPILPSSLMASQSAFPPTDPGLTEIKILPPGTLLKASASGNYFEHGNRLFRPLFRYISDHQISMTVPVEAGIEDASMSFWVAETEIPKLTGDRDEVEVVRIPERQVASRGARGGYSRENFEAVRAELLAWAQTRPDLKPVGPAYAVYWNSPFTPWFLKQFEVHLPIEPVDLTKH